MSGHLLNGLWRVYPGALKQPVTAKEVEIFAEKFGALSRRDGGIGAWPVKLSLIHI